MSNRTGRALRPARLHTVEVNHANEVAAMERAALAATMTADEVDPTMIRVPAPKHTLTEGVTLGNNTHLTNTITIEGLRP